MLRSAYNSGVTPSTKRDPAVVRTSHAVNKLIPVHGDYTHLEGNSHAHIKASLFGSSCTILVENGHLQLGTWQGIYFCEFDGPRNRKVFLKALR